LGGKVNDANAASNRLPVIAADINEHLAQAEQATKAGLEHAIEAGLLLLEARELVAHGDWLPWLRANCPYIGPRQAQTYMRLARYRHRLEALKNESAAYLTIAAAEALVGRPRPERPHGLPSQLDLGGSDWEVTAPAVNHDRNRDAEIRVGLDYALAVVRAAEPPRRDSHGWIKRRAALAAAGSMIEAALAFLREIRVRAPLCRAIDESGSRQKAAQAPRSAVGRAARRRGQKP
jgi:hypothetical protein